MKRNLDVNKTFYMVIMMNILQIVALAGTIVYALLSSVKTDSGTSFRGIYLLFGVVTIIVIFNTTIFIRDKYILTKIEGQYHFLQDSLKQLETLNHTLRGQRHDFLNHLQVVYGLMEMDAFKDAREYIEKVYNDIQKVSNSLRTSNPAVNALIQAKLLACEKRGIQTELTISSQLKDLKIPSWEFCRVLGNIIDNSIAALEEKGSDMLLVIVIGEDLKNHTFRINNNGPAIPENIQDKIFEAGFSTKGEKGEGMGLYISRGILRENGGNLEVHSDESLTVFEGWLQKN